MASVYKRSRRKPIPEDAEIVQRGGRRFAVWTDNRTKRRRRATLSDDGKAIIVQAGGYTIEWFDHDGRRRRKGTRIADKDAAQQLANKLETEAMQRRSGLIDATQERFAKEARRPLSEHLADYKAVLLARGNTDRYVEMTDARVRFIVESCGATGIGDLAASDVQQAVKAIGDNGQSLETCNSYLRAIKGFSRWLYRDKRSPADALATLKAYNAATDTRHVRRELTAEEFERLIDATERRTMPQLNLSGPDRAMLYRLAVGTGFRASELRSLATSSFGLDAEPPTVTVEAAHSKRRRTDCQPIRQDLSEVLRLWLQDRPAGERPFTKLPRDTARMLRGDLKAAGIPYTDDDGRVVDFHSLRHTYISGIVASGASVKVAQELARHSTPTLTIGRYSHARLHDLQGALDGLPGLTPTDRTSEPQRQQLQATGTDDYMTASSEQSSGLKWAHFGAQLDGETCQNVASGGETEKPDSLAGAEKNADADRRKVLPLNTFGNDSTPVASDGRKRRARDSNPQSLSGHLISSPMPLAPKPRKKHMFPIVRGQMRGQFKRKRRTMTPTCRASLTLGRPCPKQSRPASWRW